MKMPKTFAEGYLQFSFSDTWRVEKYDEHTDYVNKIQKLQETKAIDFLGVHREANIFFMEVKDFRGYRIQNKTRISDGELAREIALKVRDTIAGVIGAVRMSGEPETWRPYVNAMRAREKHLRIVLWLEEDRNVGRPEATTLTEMIKKEIFWITTRVLVVNRRIFNDIPPDLAVVSLAGAPGP